jgi:hypothetical protein
MKSPPPYGETSDLKQIPADLFGQDFQDLRRLSPTAGVGISNIEQGTSNVEVCLTAPFDYAQGMLGGCGSVERT